MHPQNLIKNSFIPYSFNGMEKDDEVKGEGNSYDFGARMLDARVGRFLSLDNYSAKFPYQSSYSFASNSPLRGIDLNGDSLYVLFYSANYSVKAADDRMFYAAAYTRKTNIESSSSFDPKKDKVIMICFEEVSSIKSKMESTVKKYSGKYGKTAEVGIWSHGSTDGPIGEKETKKFSLYNETKMVLDKNQMTLDGWSKINFNWGKNAEFTLYGCNTGVTGNSFAYSISLLSNFKDVSIYGQQKSSFPSLYTDEREHNSQMDNGIFQNKSTYMVGSDGGADDILFNDAYPLTGNKNGKTLSPKLQSGKKEPVIADSPQYDATKPVNVKLEGGL